MGAIGGGTEGEAVSLLISTSPLPFFGVRLGMLRGPSHMPPSSEVANPSQEFRQVRGNHTFGPGLRLTPLFGLVHTRPAP